MGGGGGRWGIRFRIHKASGVDGQGAGRPLPSPHHPAPPGRTRPGLRPDGQTDHWWWEAGGAGWGSLGRGVGGCDLGSESHALVLGARLSLDTSLSSSSIRSTPVAVQPSMGLPSDSGKAKARTRCGPGPQATGSGEPRSSRLPCGCLSPAGAIRMRPSGGLATLPLPGRGLALSARAERATRSSTTPSLCLVEHGVTCLMALKSDAWVEM